MSDNELTLRYGCNPHQVPARVYMKDGSPTAHPGLEQLARLHQPAGCAQLLAAGEGAERHAGPARRGLVQTRQPKRGCGGPAADGGAPAGLFRPGPGAFPARRGLCPRPRRGPHVVLRRLGGAQRHGGCPHGKADQPRGLGRRDRPGLRAGSAGNPAQQEGRQIRGAGDRSRLRAGTDGNARGVRHHLRAAAQRPARHAR